MGKKERPLQETRDKKVGRMTQGWVHNRFGVDEAPVDSIAVSKTPKAVLFDAAEMQAKWAYERFGVDER